MLTRKLTEKCPECGRECKLGTLSDHDCYEDRLVDEEIDASANETARADQLGINCTWLIDKSDRIHAALCPDANGTWQQRAEQAVKAAERLPIADIVAFVKRCADETQGLNWRYKKQGQIMPTPIAEDAKALFERMVEK